MFKKLSYLTFILSFTFYSSCKKDDNQTIDIPETENEEDRTEWPDSGFFFIAEISHDPSFEYTRNEKLSGIEKFSSSGGCLFIKERITEFTDSISQPRTIEVIRYEKELDVISCPREPRIFKFYYTVKYFNTQNPDNYLESDSARFIDADNMSSSTCNKYFCHGIQIEYGYQSGGYQYMPEHPHAVDFNNANFKSKIIRHNNLRVLKLDKMMMVATNTSNPITKYDTIYAKNIVIGYL